MIKKAKSQVVGIKPETWNQIADTINKQQQAQKLKKVQDKKPLVKAHADLKQFEVFAIDSLLFEPELDDNDILKPGCEFANRPLFISRAITSGDTVLGIVQEPVPEGKFAEILLYGISPVKIDVISITHKYAQLKSNMTDSQLESSDSGGFEILTLPTETGIQYLPVRFPVSQGGGGESVQLVQVKSVDTDAAKVQVAVVKLLTDQTPNYESAVDNWIEVNYLKDS